MSAIDFSTLLPDSSDGERLLLAKIRGRPIRGTALASATRTANTLTGNIRSEGARGIIIYLNVTAASGTGGLTVRLFGVDPLTGNVATIASVTPVATTAQLRIYQFAPGVAGQAQGVVAWGAVGVVLGELFAIQVQHWDATNYTYSVSYELIP